MEYLNLNLNETFLDKLIEFICVMTRIYESFIRETMYIENYLN